VVPLISIGDASAPESGGAGLVFPVTLSAFASQAVSVDFATSSGTATSGVDFTPAAGTLSFASTSTSESLSVMPIDDPIDEPDERLMLTLSNPLHGALGNAVGVGTILDDDPPPSLSVADASILEGNVGSRSLFFSPILSLPSGKAISLDYATGGGTASAGSDYAPASGSLSFAPGSTVQSIDVTVFGDLLSEGDESLGLLLSNGVNVTLPAGPALGTIRDDDPAVGPSTAELVHGSVVTASLAALAGPMGAHDLYHIAVPPHSSFEVLASDLAGDVIPLVLDRVAADGTTVLQSATENALRFENATSAPSLDERILVASGGCSADCGSADRYRIRALDTTAGVSRFNNSSTQVSVLLLQNTGTGPIQGHVWLWSLSGVLLGSQPISLASRAGAVLDTSVIPGGAGQSGSITVSHDGGYGALSGKAVAIEPATGFTFDTPLTYRGR
jgi:hypothetical protein